MPTAPDLATILDVPTGIENALQQAINALPIGVSAFVQRQSVNLPKERVDIQFTLGEWSGHIQRDKAGQLRRAGWKYTLVLEISSKRDPDDGDFNRHAAIRGAVLAMMQTGATFGPDVFPYHVLSSVIESGITPSLSEKEAHDVSQIHYHGLVSVRSAAWPQPAS